MDIKVYFDLLNLRIDLREGQFKCFAFQRLLFEVWGFVVLDLLRIFYELSNDVAVLTARSL